MLTSERAAGSDSPDWRERERERKRERRRRLVVVVGEGEIVDERASQNENACWGDARHAGV
jgi:hypothetical protein